MIDSSYKQNNYGEVFRAIVDAFKPVNVVELGVLHGYSTFHIAAGLKKNGRGMVRAYDLFERYPYKHANFEEVKHLFSHCSNVELFQEDVFNVHLCYGPGTVDLLHIDISNTGDKFRRLIELWDPKMVQGGVILFEGGTLERDQIEWMLKYKCEPIKPAIENNPIVLEKYIFGTYLAFPGLTMLLKKR